MAMPTSAWPARGVVDSVACHRDAFALGLESFDHRGFAFGEDVGFDFIDGELPGYGLGGGAIVAGEHDDADTFPVQR